MTACLPGGKVGQRQPGSTGRFGSHFNKNKEYFEFAIHLGRLFEKKNPEESRKERGREAE